MGQMLMWLKHNMHPKAKAYTKDESMKLIRKYIERNDEYLKLIAMNRSMGRGTQYAERDEEKIKMTRWDEQAMFDTDGIRIPDILCPKQCKLLKNWNGDLNLLHTFKYARFRSNRIIKNRMNFHL
ncbi:PREDICTED: translation machinery-associated protein 16-like [Wasmannia auropunctata]|uniref:translation machinery-associated protein 16-like n=1 Tax=Wasmannia auropunctata TaxID=64793 RepID=UPI0005EF2B00|nr:PREDICTED: translation machinery-associated protein 16-like [Wasmannia auropunctata]